MNVNDLKNLQHSYKFSLKKWNASNFEIIPESKMIIILAHLNEKQCKIVWAFFHISMVEEIG